MPSRDNLNMFFLLPTTSLLLYSATYNHAATLPQGNITLQASTVVDSLYSNWCDGSFNVMINPDGRFAKRSIAAICGMYARKSGEKCWVNNNSMKNGAKQFWCSTKNGCDRDKTPEGNSQWFHQWMANHEHDTWDELADIDYPFIPNKYNVHCNYLRKSRRRLRIESKVDYNTPRRQWEGFGSSLAWWANAVGKTKEADMYSDLIFSTNDNVALPDYFKPSSSIPVPGLGLNLVRYNLGGSGRSNDPNPSNPNQLQNLNHNPVWFKIMEGLWTSGSGLGTCNSAVASDLSTWDLTRDERQRHILDLAVSKYNISNVEFFTNAPMWWMTHEASSFGGAIKQECEDSFAKYLAHAVQIAKQTWPGINRTKTSVALFNEPSAGWWNFPKDQEGLNVGDKSQKERLVNFLRSALSPSSPDTVLTIADENTMTAAIQTLRNNIKGDRIQVHGYNGLNPWRDNRKRRELRDVAGNSPLWMSEYGDGDESGKDLAIQIMQDINYLRPSAWIYWQIIEHATDGSKAGWGPINADFGSSLSDTNRGKLTGVLTKYYAFAHFSRFIRPGDQIIPTTQENTVYAFDAIAKELKIVFLNPDDFVANVTFDLSGVDGVTASTSQTEVPVVETLLLPDSSIRFSSSSAVMKNGVIALQVNPVTLISLKIKL